MEEKKLFKDGHRGTYVLVRREDRGHYFGRSYYCKQSRAGTIFEQPIDLEDKVWIKNMHRWVPYKDSEVELQKRRA